MNNITITILLINVVLIFVLPRRYVLIPIIISGIILPMTERLYIADLDFTSIRLLLLCGWLRLIIKSEYRFIRKINNIDKIMLLYVFWAIISYTVLWQTMDAFIYKLGSASYILGTYFLVRFYITDLDDIDQIIKYLLLLAIFIAFFVAIERITQQNYFSLFGGVSYTTMIREGKLRCFGPFSHPITLGSFGAFLFPLAFYMLWKEKGSKILGLINLISIVIIVLSSSSSGPIFSLVASVIGLLMWYFRKHMRLIVWGIFLFIIGLEIVMKAHVWALINRISFFSSSSHYHRFLIIDKLIENFNEWWLIGTQSTKHWSEFIQLTDVSNNYARIAVDGGILALILFIMIITLCFRHIGKMIAFANDSIEHQKLFWIWGVAMFSYVVSFIGVSLWDQTIVIYYFIIATIASMKYNTLSNLQKKEQSTNALTF
ncbi:MAG: hypothetical protein WAW52_14840 [Methanothrix sp.]